MDCTKSHHPNVLARWPSRGAGSARMTAVTAYPTIGPNSGNSARSAEDIWPWFRGRTLKVSMALATLGLVIFLSASIKVSSFDGLKGLPALLEQQALQLFDGVLDPSQVRIHGQRALEVVEGTLGLREPQVDHAVSAQGAEVVGVALHHLIAVGRGLAVLAGEVVHGRSLVPPLGERGAGVDDLRERLDRAGHVALLHLRDAEGEQPVGLRVPRPAPDLPQGLLGEPAYDGIVVAQGLDERGHVCGDAHLREPQRAAASCLHVAARPKGLEGRLARRLLRARGGRQGG